MSPTATSRRTHASCTSCGTCWFAIDDPVGGGTGLGNAETFALGAFPERGLTNENSFL